MTPIEELLKETFHSRESRAPDAAGLVSKVYDEADRQQRKPVWLAPLVGGIAAAVIVVVWATGLFGLAGWPRSVGPMAPTPSLSSPPTPAGGRCEAQPTLKPPHSDAITFADHQSHEVPQMNVVVGDVLLIDGVNGCQRRLRMTDHGRGLFSADTQFMSDSRVLALAATKPGVTTISVTHPACAGLSFAQCFGGVDAVLGMITVNVQTPAESEAQPCQAPNISTFATATRVAKRKIAISQIVRLVKGQPCVLHDFASVHLSGGSSPSTSESHLVVVTLERSMVATINWVWIPSPICTGQKQFIASASVGRYSASPIPVPPPLCQPGHLSVPPKRPELLYAGTQLNMAAH